MKGDMIANVFYGPKDLRLERLPIPDVGPGDLLIRVRAAAVCASDVRVFRGEKWAKVGTVLGHEVAGEVAEVGQGIDEFREGDMVVLYPVIACGSCFYCRIGHRNMCLNRRTFGYDYNGAFAEYMLVPQSLENVVRVPKNLSMEEAALAEPLGCSINGVEVLGLEIGESVLIIGSGPMGLMLMAVARVAGAGKIIVSEVDEGRLRIAEGMGADVVVDPRRENLISRVKEETGGLGVDATIVTVGSPVAIEESIRTVRKEGRVNLFAGGPKGSEVRIDLNLIHYRMLKVMASQSTTLPQFIRGLTLMENKRVNLKPLITHRLPLESVKTALEKRMVHEGLKPEIFPGLKGP